jgi:hypothetical protein
VTFAEFDATTLIFLFAASAFIGAMIGAVGIGGVFLAPLLLWLGLPVQEAIAASLLAFGFTAFVGVAVYARRGSIRWADAFLLGIAAAPGALLGAWGVTLINEAALISILTLILLASGVFALRHGDAPEVAPPLSGATLGSVGFGVGAGSAMTGTGGPILFLPIVQFLKADPIASIGLAQVLPLPIALASAVLFLPQGLIDFELAAFVAVPMGAGIAGGAYFTQRLSVQAVRHGLAATMIMSGVYMAATLLA